MDMTKSLSDMKPSQTGTVISLDSKAPLYKRFLDIGLIPGTEVECVLKSPSGDPSAFLIRGAVIAIRVSDGKNVSVLEKGEICVGTY